ncbi:MAG: hypothetical protein RMJ56_00435 [Gemmataceae bacterium]|nr:hypothetical protein [Gemmata sp.]MDW8196047.1 hypothetical protein [Gemmataceae bacterium]
MTLAHYDAFFTFSTAGLGLVVAGLLNLALGAKSRWTALRVVLTVALAAVVVGGLTACTDLRLGLRAGAMMLAGVIITAGLGSDWVVRQISQLFHALRGPAPRWGLLAGAGLTLVLSSGIAFDTADEAYLDEELKELELVVGRPPSRPVEGIRATTDRGTVIVLKEPLEPRPIERLKAAEERTLKGTPYAERVVRLAPATDRSNCHGWVFTGGQFLLSPDDVELILQDNGYFVVAPPERPRSGDLVVYRQDGTIIHTAIVHSVPDDDRPMIVEGKWGTLGAFQHDVDKSFYGTHYTVYRSHRKGHLLNGLNLSPSHPESHTIRP